MPQHIPTWLTGVRRYWATMSDRSAQHAQLYVLLDDVVEVAPDLTDLRAAIDIFDQTKGDSLAVQNAIHAILDIARTLVNRGSD